MTIPKQILEYVEKALAVIWLVVASLVLLFTLVQFVADDLDARSLTLLLVGAGLLLLMSLLMLMKLPGRKMVALAMCAILGFREYMLWAHGFPEAIDIWVLRSIFITLLAVATFGFYLFVRSDHQLPKAAS
jgi:hypothetical protein